MLLSILTNILRLLIVIIAAPFFFAAILIMLVADSFKRSKQ